MALSPEPFCRALTRWTSLALLLPVLVLGASTAHASGQAASRPGDRALQTGPAVTLAAGTVTITGHGYGHGIGLGQYGALGYAVDQGWTAAQILDRYYGGTVPSTVPNTTSTPLSVRLQALDDGQTAIVQPLGAATLTYDPYHLRWRSIVIRDTAPPGQPARYKVWAHPTATVCAGPTVNLDAPGSGWVVVGQGVAGPIRVTAGDTRATTNVDALLATCEPSGIVRSYRGDLSAVNGTAGEDRTVNTVALETYLRGVVGSEMPNAWGSAGGGRGAQALRAQAVAARSYAMVQNRYSYAKTCDTQTCQVYAGAAQRNGVGGAVVRREYATTDAAIAATNGLVRRIGNASGPIASTMFSSSTGGYTAPGAAFPPVPDAGDATASNPFHTWRVSVPITTVQAAFPSIGALTQITVTSRNGYGDWGGRVLSMVVRGTSGQVVIDGDTFRRALGLRS